MSRLLSLIPALTRSRRLLRRLPRRRGRARARRSIRWFAIAAIASQVAVALTLELGPRRFADPEYGGKLNNLRARLAERPGRPLVLALGSSRVVMGLRPDLIDEPGGPVLFNAGLIGSGPLLERMALGRLLADGVRPAAVVVEFWPAFAFPPPDRLEENAIEPTRLTRRDLAVTDAYAENHERFRREWTEARAVPLYGHRFYFLSHALRNWLPPHNQRHQNWFDLDEWGWKPSRKLTAPPLTDTERAYNQTLVWGYYGPVLRNLQRRPKAEAALRDTLRLCREHGIPAAVIWLPESAIFRSWYPPDAERGIAVFLAELQANTDAVLIDARTWAADDDLLDGFHLTPAGAEVFTRRFVRDVLPVLGVSP